MELIIYNIILYTLFHNYLAQAFFKIIKKYFTYVNFLLSPLSLHVNTIMVSCLTKDQLCSFICLSADIYILKFLSCTAMFRMSVLTWESYMQPNCLKLKRSGSVWNCLWGNALKRSPGIIHKNRASYPGPGFLSSATWPSLPKKHYNGLNQTRFYKV